MSKRIIGIHSQHLKAAYSFSLARCPFKVGADRNDSSERSSLVVIPGFELHFLDGLLSMPSDYLNVCHLMFFRPLKDRIEVFACVKASEVYHQSLRCSIVLRASCLPCIELSASSNQCSDLKHDMSSFPHWKVLNGALPICMFRFTSTLAR